jgi:hypothetical protein
VQLQVLLHDSLLPWGKQWEGSHAERGRGSGVFSEGEKREMSRAGGATRRGKT